MFKSRKVDEYGDKTGNEEKTEDVQVTEEKIVGDDGVERTVIKKVTTRRTVQTQQVSQGAKVTTVRKQVFTVNGQEVDQLPDEFKHLALQGGGEIKTKQIEGSSSTGQKQSTGSASSSSDDETKPSVGSRIKSFLKGDKKKDEKKSSPGAAKASAKDEPPAQPTDDDKQFAEDALKWHNYYRTKHGVNPLKLSAELNKYAKEWANKIAARDVLEHRSEHKYGENIFMKWSTDPNFKISGKDPVENWYNEIKDHTFGKEPTSLKSGHFTQVIWKGSEELGIAKAKTKTGKIIVVANYNPAGNMIGSFSDNVPKPL